MDVGMVVRVRYLPEKPQPLDELYKLHIEDSILADELGLDFVRTTEHHFAPDAWSPSQLVILAALATVTKRVRLGTNVLLLPFHHPLRVAEDVATIDLISGGRFDLAVASGSIRDEFESFDLDPQERWGRMFESLKIIRRCFTEDVFDHHGKYFNFPNVRMTTKPVQQPVPLWVGALGPQTLKRAAKEGYHLAGGRQERSVDLYESVGRNPDDFNVFTYTSGHLSDDHEKAWDDAEVGLHHFRDFYMQRDWIAQQPDQREPPPPVGEFRKQPTAQFPVGTPDEILRALEPRFKDSRVTHYGFAFRHPGMTTEAVRKSMHMFAKEVLPEMKTWGRAPVTKKQSWSDAAKL